MSAKTTNFLCKVETMIAIFAIVMGLVCSKVSAMCWLAFIIAILIHISIDKNYLKEWCDWLWK